MVEFIPPPDALTLLPPFFACLPTAFASPRPPPALLPLLSPILRQRVQYMAANSVSSPESWLPLLSWSSEKGSKLAGIVEAASFEPHPVSGEIEPPEPGEITYKRLDDETLQAHLPLSELNLSVIYLWCVGGDQDGVGPGWRVTELLPHEVLPGHGRWSSTISGANDEARQSQFADALKSAEDAEEDDDDDYWAMYDNTPGRTPAMKRSPAPPSMTSGRNGSCAASDAAYYAQYSQVQPAMDNHDPDEAHDDIADSTLDGNILSHILRRQTLSDDTARPSFYSFSGFNHDRDHHQEQPSGDHDILNILTAPQPSSPSSHGSEAVARLEGSAEWKEASEIGVKQHISTNIKSLYRLAKSTGMERVEFERIVRRELEVLSIGDHED